MKGAARLQAVEQLLRGGVKDTHGAVHGAHRYARGGAAEGNALCETPHGIRLLRLRSGRAAPHG